MSRAGGHSVRVHWRLLLFVSAVALTIVFSYLLRSALLPFAVGWVLAYLLKPAVTWTESWLPGSRKRKHARRVMAVVLVLVLASVAGGLISYLVVASIIGSTAHLLENASQYAAEAIGRLKSWTDGLRDGVPGSARLQIDSLIQEAANSLIAAGKTAFMNGLALIPTTIGFIFGFAVLPLFVFYLLKDSEKLKSSAYAALPPWAAEHARNVVALIDKVLGRYIRAQLLLVLVVGVLDFVGLQALGIPAAPALASFAGAMEVVPVVGPWIAGVLALVVALATVPQKAIAVALLFASVQVLENLLLVPRIQAAYLKLHPVAVIALLVIGTYLAGFWGLLLAVPLTATVVEILRYARQRVAAEDGQPTSTD